MTMNGFRAAVRKCTCLVDTESDSEDDLPLPASMSATSSISSVSSALTAGRGADTGAPVELRRKVSGQRDPISTSMALHNSEALRQAQVLQNVFCACYEVETVLSLVQRRERLFSPVQIMLLKKEHMATVFQYATSLPERKDAAQSSNSSGCSSAAAVATNVNGRSTMDPTRADPERYRRCFVATELILKFYLRVMAWHGSPRMPTSPRVAACETLLSPTSPTGSQRRRRYSADASTVTSPSHRQILSFGATFKGKAAAQKGKQLVHSSVSMHDVPSANQRPDADAIDSPEVRGYLIQLEDLTESEWKTIFSPLYRFLWTESGTATPMAMISEAGVTGELGAPVDPVLVANMCRITKSFVVFPAVLKLLSEIHCPVRVEGASLSSTSLFTTLSAFAYCPEIGTLLHGLIHLIQRRKYSFDLIVQSIVDQLAHASATTSTSRSINAQVFSLKRTRFHETVSGCADILMKILTQQFPNTFRYYIQTKIQLASFESVEPFERELFPPKIPPSDQSLHADIKNAVMTALLDEPDTLLRLADLSLSELRYLDAYHASTGIPPTLVIDVIRSAIECSLQDRTQLELFLPCSHRLVETLSAAINFHQHMTTISEFASRDCFSDSDSDDESADVEDEDDEEGNGAATYDASESTRDARRSSKEEHGTVPSRILPFDDDVLSKKEGYLPSTSMCLSPTSGRQLVNHRPLTSILLILHAVDFFDAVLRMGIDAIDNRLTRMDLSTSLVHLFERFPKANVLHCRLLKLFLNLFDRNTTGRVNNPFLRSVFRPPNSIQEFIMTKLHKSPKTHPYDPHLAILGVKIDKICSAPTLQQEIIRQYCTGTPAWTEFSSSLVARHYQQMDALDDRAMGMGGASNFTGRRASDGLDDVFPLSQQSSSSCDFLTGELQPFRRLPMEKEGFGSSQNLAMGTDAVHPTDMLQSRTKSQYPQSIIDILRNDPSTSFDVTEDETSFSGYAYQKLAKWVKVHLKFDKATCVLICQEVSKPATASSTSAVVGVSSPTAPPSAKKPAAISTSKLKQLWMQHKPHWTTRPKKYVVCNARKWIAFGRTVKNPNVGAFGFQIDVFDRIREEDQTLTFVTRSERSRTEWFEVLNQTVSDSRTLRHQSFSEVDEEANIMLVKCVATQREGASMVYLAVPDVHVLAPVISSSFSLKSEVPEEIPFWGTFQGPHGVSKYCSLFNRCLHVVAVQEKRVYASGYSVIVEFDATLQAIESPSTPVSTKPASAPGRLHLRLQLPPAADSAKTVTCSFTDTYLVTSNQIVSMTRTIADSEKLVKVLCDDPNE